MAQQRFVLVGPNAGKDFRIGDHQFENGIYDYEGGASTIEPLTRYFSHWGAVTEQEARLAELEALVAKPNNLQQEPQGEDLTQMGGDMSQPSQEPASDKPSLAEAIGTLDPENDAHWTSNNLPAIEHLEVVTGIDLNRAAIEEVAKGYTRAKARAARA